MSKNFIVGYKLDEKNNKIIHSYGQNTEGSFRDSLISSGKYLETDFCEYIVGENLDYYVNGKRMSDYEIFLKFGINPSDDMTYNYNGALVQKTDEQKMIDGVIPVKEGFEISDGKIVPIPYYFLRQAYSLGADAFYKAIKDKIEEYKTKNEESILVKMDGVSYNINQASIDTLMKLINLDMEIEWRDNSNNIQKLSKEKALKLVKTVEEKKQSILKKIWEAKDTIKSMIESKKAFEEVIDYVEAFLSQDIKFETCQIMSDTFIDTLEVPAETPYSGLISEDEIKKLKSKKGLKKSKS